MEIKMSQLIQNPPSKSEQFDRNANGRTPSMTGEFFFFLSHNKKWWLLPIITILLMLGVLVILGGTAMAPFIYTLF